MIRSDRAAALRDGLPTPVDCLVVRPRYVDCDEVAAVAAAAPLHPAGSLWVGVAEKRLPGGGLDLLPERLVVALVEQFHLADRVHWSVPQGGGLASGDRRRYLGSAGTWLRFIRLSPLEAHATWPSGAMNVMQRSLQEEPSWYEPLIIATCPPGGLVVDAYCDGPHVAMAALAAGRRFVGISPDPAL